MSGRDPLQSLAELAELDVGPPVPLQGAMALPAVVVGELLALVDGGRNPLVAHAGQRGPGAVRGRSLVDLEGRHVGQAVALLFEQGDPQRPVVVGVLGEAPGWPAVAPPGQVELEAGGARMVVSARRELVLRCGLASITLREDGQVEIRGEAIVSQAAGPNRIRGGSVELN